MKKLSKKGRVLATFPLSALSLAVSGALYGQSDESAPQIAQEVPVAQAQKPKLDIASPIEEVLVLGRMQSAAGDVVLERMEHEVPVDLISAELISRVGDSNVASALRRVPGVTLIDDKFVYVRGLGERYSSTTLNDAAIPSPDLTRNVVPLDIFPTSIVESLSVQKVASADMSAAFGGGAIDIRTRSIPDAFLLTVALGTGSNSNAGDFYTYSGGNDDSMGKDDGSRALSSNISNAITRYRGNFGDIARIDDITQTEADDIIRNLALDLNRNIDIKEEDGKIDQSAAIDVGNNFVFANQVEFGFLAGISYDTSWRNSEKSEIVVQDATHLVLEQSFEKESTYNVSVTGNLNVGLRLNPENNLKTTSLFIRNTDDKASIKDSFDNDAPISENSSERTYDIRYEQREMRVNQIHGEHELGPETLETIGWSGLDRIEGLQFNWFFSDSESTSDIPNEVTIDGGASFESFQPYVLTPRIATIQANNSSANYRFTELQDNMESYGWEISLPFESEKLSIDISGGSEYWEKARTYRQLQLGLGTVDQDANLLGLPDTVFSDANIVNPENGYQINVARSNSDSYMAAAKATAAYGKFDITWDATWRVAGGLRWEDYQQVGLAWDILDFTGSQLIPNNVENRAYDATAGNSNIIADFFDDATFSDDDIYASLAFTYMTQDFFAEDFNLRFGFSETTVRPDLREITDSSYIDPITDFLVFGESNLVPSQFKNYDVRAEWFFESGDSLSLSLFYKDITDPIDVQEEPRSDDDRAMKFFNAESAEITGIELEFLKSLGNVAEVLEPFFIQGNATILDTNIIVGDQALDATNSERELAGASDTLNLIFGYDSDEGKHASTLSYNWFGERLSFAGRNNQNDVFEQPSSSLDFTYAYYPIDQLTVKFKAKNLLNEALSFKRENASSDLLKEEKGLSYSVSMAYKF
ncbi:MAG: TonB-dependent receptor plug domain-containing protein [Agarilytica sp.]